MKTLILTLLTLLTTATLWAQAPQRISYQAVIRDGNNVVVASSPVGIKISLLRGTATGPAVYVETHGIITNANGLMSLNIGEGRAISGRFAEIDWSKGPYLIQTATDPTGGTDYSIIGIGPLNSVPYALNAGIANALAGTLAIANGGTGATTATAARAALGLENVDNTSDANKPVSTATETSLSTKVDKVTGKELSTNDYTTTEKTKLAAITGSNTGDQLNIAGNAATATKLQRTVTINGIAFDGSANITLPSAAAGIPYTGATQAVDLGAYDLKVNGVTVGRGNGNGESNTATGNEALASNTTGSFNMASGTGALKANTTGSYNTASGEGALRANTAGSLNMASGNIALLNNTTGDFNTASGNATLFNNTSGDFNTASGIGALYQNTTGSNNTAIGNGADVESGALTNATAIGAGAKVNASNTIQLGNTDVTKVITSGTLTAGAVTYPRVHGAANQVLTTTGTGTLTWATPSGGVPYTGATQSLDLGAYDLKVNGLTVGLGPNAVASNTVLGNDVLSANVSGSDNTVIGKSALRTNTTGSYNTAIGVNVLYSNTTGNFNTATGRDALFANLTGNYNTASGYASLAGNTVGQFNTATGESALFANTVGNYNTATGLYALRNNVTGSNNTGLGYNADVASGALTNATAIGNGAVVTTSNTIQLGADGTNGITAVTNVKTSGTLTAGTVTYPNAHNSTVGQVLTTNASGVASWATPATGLPSSENTSGDMLFWNGSAWVKVAAGSNGQNLTFYNGAPIWVGAFSYSYAGATAYANTVLNPKTGKIWMDRNLGATRVATSSTDAAAYGDLYQWGRGADGHQLRTSLTTPTLSSLDLPVEGKFILASNVPYDWRIPQNTNLWQGVNGINNPCPSGYRLPTDLELVAELASWSSSDPAGAFASPLKLPVAGRRLTNGGLYPENTAGLYWSSTVRTIYSGALFFSNGYTEMNYWDRANGGAVRCIKN